MPYGSYSVSDIQTYFEYFFKKKKKSYYQQDSKVLYTFFSYKLFGHLLDISPKNFIFLKDFDSKFAYIEVWFIDESSKLLEIEDKINIT